MQKVSKRLWDIGRMAWDRLILTGAPPTPENYALWYHATGGTVEGLPEAMAELAQAGMLAQPGALDSIQARFFPNGIKAGGDGPAPAPTPEAKPAETRPSSLSLVYRVSGEAGDIMEAASAALSQADKANSGYAETLAGLQPTHIDTPSSLKSAIRLLTEETDKVIGENTALREQLDGLSARLKALREELAGTQTELGRAQANLSEARIAAETDALTHLPNRRRFEQDLSALLRSADGRFCLVLADIDFFKNFNDQHGHVMGDQVLRLVAQGLARRVEKLGRAYRFGGEEFALLIRDLPVAKVFELCEAIRRDVATREVVNRSTAQPLGRITLSAGITAARIGEEADTIIDRADRALYAAKNQGRNRVICDPPLAPPA
ncbi:diguanylate cyclase domain-containing protein [Elstera cyanobacteriorum]|uniref:diguanylate cyclase domain-containing protein n=1 Tax=Elstera cyanobacteriorum TaxID=2022747 RepID=UPI00148398E9|nr:diguanylate cyclase [Elstera cyanobacteriorum]